MEKAEHYANYFLANAYKCVSRNERRNPDDAVSWIVGEAIERAMSEDFKYSKECYLNWAKHSRYQFIQKQFRVKDAAASREDPELFAALERSTLSSQELACELSIFLNEVLTPAEKSYLLKRRAGYTQLETRQKDHMRAIRCKALVHFESYTVNSDITLTFERSKQTFFPDAKKCPDKWQKGRRKKHTAIHYEA